MLKADDYNAKRIASGDISPDLVTQLTRHWQASNDLIVDGKLGPRTALSIRGQRVGTLVMLKALSRAQLDIGRGEVWGNNQSLFLDMVRSKDGTGLPWEVSGPWCASIVSFWFHNAIDDMGVQGLVPWKSSRGARALGRFLRDNAFICNVPEPGSIGIYSRGLPGGWKGHAVIFESYDPETDSAVCIEGNKGKFPALVKRTPMPNGEWRKRLIGVYSL